MLPNIELVKGLFSDSLPPFLEKWDASLGKKGMVTYLHIDCDLYAGESKLAVQQHALQPMWAELRLSESVCSADNQTIESVKLLFDAHAQARSTL